MLNPLASSRLRNQVCCFLEINSCLKRVLPVDMASEKNKGQVCLCFLFPYAVCLNMIDLFFY